MVREDELTEGNVWALFAGIAGNMCLMRHLKDPAVSDVLSWSAAPPDRWRDGRAVQPLGFGPEATRAKLRTARTLWRVGLSGAELTNTSCGSLEGLGL